MKIERVELISGFRTDRSVVLSIGPSLRSLASTFGGEILTLNVPEGAPLEFPRAAVRFDRLVLQVALNRFQFVVQPPPHVTGSPVDALKYAANRAEPLLNALNEFLTVSYEWSAVIVPVEFPFPKERAATPSQLLPILFRRMIAVPWQPEDVATFNVQIGYRRGDFFRNYTITAYEVREMEFVAPKGPARISLDMSQGVVTEVGIGVALDVNNKPAKSKMNASADLESALREASQALETLATDLNLEGVL